MSFGFEVEGIDTLADTLRRLRQAGLDTLKPRKLIREEMLLRTAQRFSAGVSPDGTPWPASARALGIGGQTLHNTGRLLGSIDLQPEGEDLVFFSDDIRARILNDGGTIVPKNAKALAIPLSEAVANAHRAGVSIREQYPDAFLLRSHGGGLFIVRRDKNATGEGSMLSQLEFLYVLVSSVEEPPRKFLDFGPDDLEMIDATFIRHFSAAEQGGN